MSRRGNCWDNAVAERFFLNLKIERVWQRQYANRAEAKADITDYIVGFYNCKRINSALGNLSPAKSGRSARHCIGSSSLLPRFRKELSSQIINGPKIPGQVNAKFTVN